MIQFVLQNSLTMSEYAFGEKYAKNAAEKYIFAHAMQDKARHLAYGISHLKYVLLHKADRREEVQRYLDKGEAMLLQDDKKDNATKAAWALYFGGGAANGAEGLKAYAAMRRHFVTQYLDRLKWATLERGDRLSPGLRAFIES